MSEDERPKVTAQDEKDDDTEAHVHRTNANEEPASEGDDEVEAHAHQKFGHKKD